MPIIQTIGSNKNYEILTELFGYDCKGNKDIHKVVTRKNPFIHRCKC